MSLVYLNLRLRLLTNARLLAEVDRIVYHAFREHNVTGTPQ